MRILVLDTVHGGTGIGTALHAAGNAVDMVDVYHGTTPDAERDAHVRPYDLIVAPVHLDPDHALFRSGTIPVISHHEAVFRILGGQVPHPMIEITGARGKTTTACALASVLPGSGILHTSAGTFQYPDREFLWKKSITPASVIPAAARAYDQGGWLVAEESLGVTGAGDLAILTSAGDYPCAAGKKSALAEKIVSVQRARTVLVAPGIRIDHPHAIHLEDVARCEGSQCTVTYEGMTRVIENPLFLLPPYRTPLMLAAAAAMILHVDPLPLSRFEALPGRLSASRENGVMIIDNANSGMNVETTICAARYARYCSGEDDLTLVIGRMAGDGAVCEGFSPAQIAEAITGTDPARVILVGDFHPDKTDQLKHFKNRITAVCATLAEGRRIALESTRKGPVVLAVKTWR
jgi:UDP-N-acetylmuramyl pentapeptide synthase